MFIPDPIQSQYIIDRHSRKFLLHNTTHVRLREATEKVFGSLASYSGINNLDAVLKTTELQNEIEEADLVIQEPLKIIFASDGSSKHNAKWRVYQERK